MDIVNITTERLKLAQVRFYSESHRGVEIPREKAYAFLYRLEDDQYINLLDPLNELPVYERVPYANSFQNGESYGTKISLVSGDSKSGACYVMENIGFDRIFEEKTITMDQLKKYILASDKFFIDRPKIVEDSVQGKGFVDRFIAFDKKYRDDKKKQEEFQQYLLGCLGEEIQK